MKEMTLRSIGTIRVNEGKGVFRLEIDEPCRPALKGLESCSHATVLWWAHREDTPEKRRESLVFELPYAPGVESGVFANRSQARPNPIGITSTLILGVNKEEGTVDLAWIDAFDGTPVLDIKPYLPMSDRIMSAEYPDWLKGFPDSMEAAAEFFSNPENADRFS